ncbi:MAG: hypothetical protein M1825_001348 [Sarcosagium campestre]|nr:MAG: hypothetical protein M1825_001348 [Sarcosagium campestre]
MVSFLRRLYAGKLPTSPLRDTALEAVPVSMPQPYRHTPTHAISDAIATSPSSYRDDDRKSLRKQRQRRGAASIYSGTSIHSSRCGSTVSLAVRRSTSPASSSVSLESLPQIDEEHDELC